MKLSIWQQFSSNHSAGFTIIAKFASREDAEIAVELVTELLLESYRWKTYSATDWDNNPARIKQMFEQNLFFGTSWMLSEQHLRRALSVMDTLVYVTDEPGYNNFDGSDKSFIKFFNDAGALELLAIQETGEDVEMTLSADADDEQAAQEILKKMKAGKNHRGEREYRPDFKVKDGYFVPAQTIRAEGKRVYFEKIYASYRLASYSLAPWYAFLKTQALGNINLSLHGMETQKHLSFPLDDKRMKQMFWYSKLKPYHTPNFAIAHFENSRTAKAAATKLREMLMTIQAWSKANPTESQQIWETFWEQLSPIEIALKLEYNIDWPMSAIEWIHLHQQSADTILVQHEEKIVLVNTANTCLGITPFDAVLGKLGARKIESFSTSLPWLDFEITTANELEAEEILGFIEKSMSEKRYDFLPFYRDYPNPETWQEDLALFKLQDEAAKTYIRALEPYDSDTPENDKIYNPNMIRKALYNIPQLFDEKTLRLRQIILDCTFQYTSLSRDKHKIHLHQARFENAESFLGVEAFMLWLRSKNCEIKFYRHET